LSVIEIIAASVFALLTLASVVLVFASLPGVWMLALAAVITQWVWPDVLGWWVVGGALAGALLAEAIDLVAGAAGAKAAGGSKSAALGATVGAIAGAILGTIFIPVPVLGTILGAVLGAGVGAAMIERGVHQKKWSDTARVARGAATGRALAIVLKGGLAVVLGVVLVVASLV